MVLDVSNLNDQGNGMKMISKPSQNDRIRHGISELSIVSSNETSFEHVIDVLGLSDRKGEWAMAKTLANARTPKRISPKKIKSINDE